MIARNWRRALGLPWLVSLLAVAPAAAADSSRARRPAEDRLDPTRDIRFEQRLGEVLPGDLAVRDDRGRESTLQDQWSSRPVVFAFVYYECPMLCGLVFEGLVKSLRLVDLQVGKDFDLRVLSIDPEETPELATAARETFLERAELEDNDGVRFLLADSEEIRAATQAAGFEYVYDPVSDEFAHAAGVMVTTPGRVLSRYFYGIDYSPRDLRLGLVEASDGKIGSLVDQFLLLCLHYDPTTGKYGPVIMGTIQASGVATVAVLATSVWWMLRRDRRRRKV